MMSKFDRLYEKLSSNIVGRLLLCAIVPFWATLKVAHMTLTPIIYFLNWVLTGDGEEGPIPHFVFK